MSKFKEGDKVKIVSCLQSTYRYANKIGQEFILDKYKPPFGWNTKEDYYSYLEECDIEIVQEKEMFDMKKQPWFIRVNNKEEWEIVQDWLENNFGCAVDCSYGYIIKLVTNVDAVGKIRGTVMWESDVEIKKKQAQEIKLTFKTIIDSVEYPVVKSERDLKIEELEQSIKEAQQRLNELKEMK